MNNMTLNVVCFFEFEAVFELSGKNKNKFNIIFPSKEL